MYLYVGCLTSWNAISTRVEILSLYCTICQAHRSCLNRFADYKCRWINKWTMITVINVGLYSTLRVFSEYITPLNYIFRSSWPLSSNLLWSMHLGIHGKCNSFAKIGNFPGRKYEIFDLWMKTKNIWRRLENWLGSTQQGRQNHLRK